MNSLFKGLLMGLFGVIAAAFSDMETLNGAYIVIVASIFTAQYLVKNYFLPSLSDKWSVKTQDFISGILTAIFMGLSVYAASLLTGVEYTWIALWKAVTVAVSGYFIKTVPSKAEIK